MTELFLTIVNMSLNASYLLLAIILLRLALKKAPQWIKLPLWGLVALRLISPVFPQSSFSLLPQAQTISLNLANLAVPSIYSGIPIVDNMANALLSQSFTAAPGASVNPLQIWLPILAALWLLGIALLWVYAGASYLRLRRQVATAVLLQDNICQSENIPSPFLLGLLQPKIYLPLAMDETTAGFVVQHEQAHIRRHDQWWKAAGFLFVTVYWFNPLMWLAFWLLCQDMEMACDEKAVANYNREQKAAYAQALLNCSLRRQSPLAHPLAFGESDVKRRVKAILQNRKPTLILVFVAAVAGVIITICFLTNPYASQLRLDGEIYIRQGAIVQTLPANSYLLGYLRHISHNSPQSPQEDFQATNLDAKYAGCPIYQSGSNPNLLYLYDYQGLYLPFALMPQTTAP